VKGRERVKGKERERDKEIELDLLLYEKEAGGKGMETLIDKQIQLYAHTHTQTHVLTFPKYKGNAIIIWRFLPQTSHEEDQKDLQEKLREKDEKVKETQNENAALKDAVAKKDGDLERLKVR